MEQKTLTKKEQAVLDKLLKSLKVPKPKTKQQIIVAMVGLIGSSRESVASYIANKIGASLVSADDIRIELRKQEEKYTNVRWMVDEVSKNVLERGGSVVIDSDFIDPDKRNKLKKIAKDTGVQVYYIRTFSDQDTFIGRIITGTYSKSDFFGGAGSNWKGKNKGAVVKVREMWRRTPHHYAWDSTGGGEWIRKSMSFVFEEVDTTDTIRTKKQIESLVKKLRK